MMIPRERLPYWIAGIAAAALGLALDRLSGVLFGIGPTHILHQVGRILALGGIFIIMIGTRRRKAPPVPSPLPHNADL